MVNNWSSRMNTIKIEGIQVPMDIEWSRTHTRTRVARSRNNLFQQKRSGIKDIRVKMIEIEDIQVLMDIEWSQTRTSTHRACAMPKCPVSGQFISSKTVRN